MELREQCHLVINDLIRGNSFSLNKLNMIINYYKFIHSTIQSLEVEIITILFLTLELLGGYFDIQVVIFTYIITRVNFHSH